MIATPGVFIGIAMVFFKVCTAFGLEIPTHIVTGSIPYQTLLEILGRVP